MATRNMLQSYGKRGIYVSLAVAVVSTAAFNAFYVWPRHNKYEEFFANYDPYTRMKEICAANKGYMHTCPKELAKLYEEKGKAVAEH
ncbi:Mitochondrial cytochrome c oxidase subunit VIc/VIIs domain-containing protein [Caenorhabditis elegans]|uniref:Mitochondrial cytochrome c oxidase subunit VIc/VIIs domain-containing protein n=1 Tax=Caenorhabditis elegans TaxID=6239 RepID=Q9BHL9_CAEEL|nr:Mitochondrial cytochrome c oxidase subunit VIc/VIIs domain-containing protein [Caenorhabditis elegans]CAC35833.1 Mitochondrial cytochrome c oxidase subunit VIc/VIIs domain-containing protein [Caenorhabditis elegans]|eukprot:NP_499632.1 Uncharacterized protein CELE_Y111B2A.2 [Caenorhabditis elegans]